MSFQPLFAWLGDATRGTFAWVSANLIASGVVVALITSLASLWVSHNSAEEKSIESIRSFDVDFVKFLTASILANTKALASTGNVDDEQQAAVSLLALEGLASTQNERRTVLLVGARLLNASSKREDTGHPAARFLDLAIGEIEQQLADGVDKQQNQDLLNLLRSPSFVDLVSAGYADEYYNDAKNPESPIQPTLFGDQPITHSAKAKLLYEIGPKNVDGWIDVATWQTDIRVSDSAGSFPVLSDFENLRRHMKNLFFDHVAPTLEPRQLGELHESHGLRVLDARLLRDRPPTVFFQRESGNIVKFGDLGRVVGAIPAAACVNVVDQPKPVLVFVNPFRLGKLHTSRHALVGLIHLWAHVNLSEACVDGMPNVVMQR
jgi:hypothetical protein